MSKKACSAVFSFDLDLELLIKCKKRVCRNQVFLIFENNSRSKQKKTKKKSCAPFCRYWLVGNVCEVSAKNIELQDSWSSSKFSNFQTKYLVSRK